MTINDGFGDRLWVESTLGSYDRWLHRMAYEYLPVGSPLHDDLVQEGRIAMWRALATYDAASGALPTWLTNAAKMRMKDLAFGHGQETGHEAVRGSRQVEEKPLESVQEAYGDQDGMVAALGYIDSLGDVEIAYHHGEVVRALETLSPAQREYVFYRFWGGLDPSSRVPEMRRLVDEFPVLRKRFLWNGSSKQVGAKQRLADALAHLVSA